MPDDYAGGSQVSQQPDINTDPITRRLEDQIDWYDRKSRSAQHIFTRTKIAEILAAAAIPFLASLSFPHEKLVTAGLGVLITMLEGILHLNQYQQNWTNYRYTCEALKHEKYLYLAGAGPYTNAATPRALLAERVESTVSHEHAQVGDRPAASGQGTRPRRVNGDWSRQKFSTRLHFTASGQIQPFAHLGGAWQMCS